MSGTAPRTVTLAQLRERSHVSLELHGYELIGNLDTSGDGCASLGPDAIAMVDGVPIELAEARWAGWCLGEMIHARQAVGGTLVLADATDTWTIALPGFDVNGEPTLTIGPLVAGATTVVTWNGGPTVASACVGLYGAPATTDYYNCPDLSEPAPNLAVRTGPDNRLAFDVPALLAGSVTLSIGMGGSLEVAGRGVARGAAPCDGPAACDFDLWAASWQQAMAVTSGP